MQSVGTTHRQVGGCPFSSSDSSHLAALLASCDVPAASVQSILEKTSSGDYSGACWMYMVSRVRTQNNNNNVTKCLSTDVDQTGSHITVHQAVHGCQHNCASHAESSRLDCSIRTAEVASVGSPASVLSVNSTNHNCEELPTTTCDTSMKRDNQDFLHTQAASVSHERLSNNTNVHDSGIASCSISTYNSIEGMGSVTLQSDTTSCCANVNIQSIGSSRNESKLPVPGLTALALHGQVLLTEGDQSAVESIDDEVSDGHGLLDNQLSVEPPAKKQVMCVDTNSWEQSINTSRNCVRDTRNCVRDGAGCNSDPSLGCYSHYNLRRPADCYEMFSTMAS